MAVSVSTSLTAAVRQSLADNMKSASLSALKMSTGENYINAYEDPTGYAIGSSMRADLKVLEVVKTGIEQTKSMLLVAEAGMKSIKQTVEKLYTILAKAKLGYMTDDLVKNTLSPEYVQMKQEVDRIAKSLDFNGQKLLNGSGGKKTDATASTASSTPVITTISTISGTLTAATAGDFIDIFDSTASVKPNTSVTPSGGTYTISGGTYDSTTNTLTGAKLTITGVTLTDGAGTPVSGQANITIDDVELTFAAAPTYDKGSLSDTGAPTITLPVDMDKYTFSSTSTGVKDWELKTGTITAPTLTLGSGATLNGFLETYALSGGKPATSTFSFVTGNDLNVDRLNVVLPNMSLTTQNGIIGMVEVVNTSENILNSTPTDLSDLLTISDADKDIPIVEALLEFCTNAIAELGAYESRMNNIDAQLGTAVEEIDNAQGAIMNADLPKENERFARSNVKSNIAIAVLSRLNAGLEALQRLVQG